ncbi:hypothetical protein BGX28_009841 [Mortierella sp. GBA30]|nr:hypothetical protein BGX28_009841 [Mortierella sp. GBA30]
MDQEEQPGNTTENRRKSEERLSFSNPSQHIYSIGQPLNTLNPLELQNVIASLSVDTEDLNINAQLPPRISLEESSIRERLRPQENNPDEHVSTIDPDLLPVNWPKHVKYLVDYEYHLSIPASLLDLVQGRRRKKNEHGKMTTTRAKSTTSAGLDGVAQEQEAEELMVEETQTEPRSELELEYDDIPFGHAKPGILRSISPSTSPSSSPSICKGTATIPSLSSSSLLPSSPEYEIRLITSPPDHPALGSYGLFATKTLFPGQHLLDYISLVVPDEFADPNSDHTLYLSNDLNLDASVHGNHGRFVNDFRGIRTQEQGPNVGWDLYRDIETGQIRMGCKVLKRIKKGEEILCTYGKAYWKSRGVVVTGEEWENGWDTDLDDDGKEDEEGIEIENQNLKKEWRTMRCEKSAHALS